MNIQELVNILERTGTGSNTDLDLARVYLATAAEQDLSGLLKELSDILLTATNKPIARAQAALQLKNALYTRESDLEKVYQERWLNIRKDIRDHIKNNCFNALGTETTRPSQAAQCVGYIAIAELPRNEWPDLIERLVNNVTTADRVDNVREASLEALGYICQDINPNVLKSQSDRILTAIVYRMRKEETNDDIKLAAATAMYNSLEFTKNNFQNDNERNYIMEVICDATQSKNIKLQIAALRNLVRILSLYYDFMELYMNPALFSITMNAMQSTDDDIALQGIEFWSNVCDEEYELQLIEQEAEEENRQPERKSRKYATDAVKYLIPILLQRLTIQEETDDDDIWNPCKAAGVCLMLCANCIGNEIIQHVFPFINENIKHPDWKHREAAVMAFGSILEGPDLSSIKTSAEQAVPLLLELLHDTNIAVRDTAAWTIGRIFEFVSQVVMTNQSIQTIVQMLLNSLRDEPRVATNICWSFSSLARSTYDYALILNDNETPETYLLTPYFNEIIKKLIETTDRIDANKSNLRNAAYEALMEMIRHSPKDCYTTVQETTLIILGRLNHVLSVENQTTNSNDRVQLTDLQSLLCATLQNVLRKMQPNDVPIISDSIMQVLSQMLKTNTVREDAFATLGTLIEVSGLHFLKYIDFVLPFIYESLENHSEYQICEAAVSVISDLSRSLFDRLVPYCDQIMTHLLKCVSDDKLHRTVKPLILNTFGDIALAINGHFKRYLEHVLTVLNQACRAKISKIDYEIIDYMNELHEGCLIAYTGILQGLRSQTTNNSNLLAELQLVTVQLPLIIEFLETIAKDSNRTESVLNAAIGLIGDLVTSYGQYILQFIQRQSIENLLIQGKRSKIMKTKTLANWAIKEIGKLKK